MQVTAEIEISRMGIVGSVLGPDKVKGRAGQILPAENRSASERFKIKIWVMERKGWSWFPSIRVNGIATIGIADG